MKYTYIIDQTQLLMESTYGKELAYGLVAGQYSDDTAQGGGNAMFGGKTNG